MIESLVHRCGYAGTDASTRQGGRPWRTKVIKAKTTNMAAMRQRRPLRVALGENVEKDGWSSGTVVAAFIASPKVLSPEFLYHAKRAPCETVSHYRSGRLGKPSCCHDPACGVRASTPSTRCVALRRRQRNSGPWAI